MRQTSLEQARALAASGPYKTVPVSREIFSDLRTPVEVLRSLKNVSRHCFMLESVEEIYREEFEDGSAECLCQTPTMQEREREEFLGAFREGRKKTLVGFCVMGGIFAEGIDLSGEKLIGALVVGTGLPQVSDERELLRSFYDQKGENGFDYAYRFPGMNKVLQSAGRVIRTTEDRGVIALLDDRFCTAEYRALFPREWADADVCTLKGIRDLLQEFWSRS